MTRINAGFSADSVLMDLLRNRSAWMVLRQRAPSVVESTLLHTYHSHPIGLVLETEQGLTEQDRLQILSELAAIEATAPVSAERQLPAAPTRTYENDTIAVGSAVFSHAGRVGLWERLSVTIQGPSHMNPFVDVELRARFFGPDGVIHDVLGYYAGGGAYGLRFLAPSVGTWRFETTSNARSLDGLMGSFEVDARDARGPVRIAEQFHFAYASGERYLPIGTTSYAWTHQGDELEQTTLRTLANGPFNKIRMCVFPKSYTFNSNEPERFPYHRADDGSFDHERFDPEYWDHLERRIDQLDALGIEADLVLFHAYDRWGFSTMDAEADDRYVRYAVSRLSAFRNIWWSLANEFDLMFQKTEADWERWAQLIQQWDASDHLRSIHNCRVIYDHSRPWITHVSMQRLDVYKTSEMTTEWRAAWGKPVVVDECAYEGDIDQGWGNITGEEMTRRFWEGALRGGYVGHGETYMDPHEILWWAKGGELHGTSPSRIRFLADIIRDSPLGILEPISKEWDVPVAGVNGEYFLYYFGLARPRFRRFFQDPGVSWRIEIIDTWSMTIETVPGLFSGRFVVDLPARPYLAIRLRRAV